MKKLFLIASTIFLTVNGYSQKDSINSHARQLLYVTGSGKLGIQVMNNMLASFKKNMPSVPGEFWDEFSKELSPDELVELLVPIYAKHYSDEEMLALIKFYQTPLGQKVIEKLPLISQDSFYAGQEWGKKIGEKALARLKEKGYMSN